MFLSSLSVSGMAKDVCLGLHLMSLHPVKLAVKIPSQLAGLKDPSQTYHDIVVLLREQPDPSPSQHPYTTVT